MLPHELPNDLTLMTLGNYERKSQIPMGTQSWAHSPPQEQFWRLTQSFPALPNLARFLNFPQIRLYRKNEQPSCEKPPNLELLCKPHLAK